MKILIRNADYLLTLDQTRRIITDGAIAIEGGAIQDIGKTEDLLHRHRSNFDRIIDAKHKLIMPGMIDAHVHSHEHLARGLFPDNVNTFAWTVEWAYRYYGSLTPDEEYLSALLCCIDMIKGGTTCFLETGARFTDMVAEAARKTGIRAILGNRVMDKKPSKIPTTWSEELIGALYYDSAEQAIKTIESSIRRLNGANNGRIRHWVAINGKRTCSDELYVKAMELSKRLGVGFEFHITSSIEEAMETEKETGDWPISHLDKIGALGPNVLLVHAVFVKDNEIEIIKKRGSKICFCPGTALRVAKGATKAGKFPEMIEAGIPVALGCDGAGGAGSFDMVRQIHLVAGLFKDARVDPSMIPAEKAVEMATIDGAKSLLMEGEIGSLEVGKRADIVLFDLKRPEWLPIHNVVDNLVYSANGQSVDTVIIDGQVVMEEGMLKNINEQDILEKARELAPTLAERIHLKPSLRWPLV
jgi:cytosine/adenosine deaminase-related metal-dependent hydrolase